MRQATPDLTTLLSASAYKRDDFFELVRTLERHHRARSEAHCIVGGDGPPAHEPVRFHATCDTAFPGRAVERIWRRSEGGEQVEMTVTFMSLTGAAGVLPLHYSRTIQARLRQRDTALALFFDLFNHRFIALFYRAWAKYRLTIQSEEHGPSGRANPFARLLRALTGHAHGRNLEAQLYYAGHFSRHVRSASTLELLLADFLHTTVQVETFVGQWLPIRTPDRLRIGSGSHGRNHTLGARIMAGKRLWDMQSRLTITIGPLSHITFETLLPGGSAFERLRQLIEAYVPPSQNVELRYLIDDTERRALGNDLQLGRTAWLHGSGLRHARLPLGSRTTHPWNASRKGILDDGIRTTDQENVAGVPATV